MDTPHLHFERPRPSRLHIEPRKLLNFDFNAEPDPSLLLNADPDPNFHLGILLLNKGMRICDHWSMDPPELHLEPQNLHLVNPRPFKAPYWTLKAPADLDPAFHSNADTDQGPVYQNTLTQIHTDPDSPTWFLVDKLISDRNTRANQCYLSRYRYHISWKIPMNKVVHETVSWYFL